MDFCFLCDRNLGIRLRETFLQPFDVVHGVPLESVIELHLFSS